MRTVYKYPLNVKTCIYLPKDAVCVLVSQLELAYAWFELDTDKDCEERIFDIVGTGDSILKGSVHVGSFFQPPFVWHLYERSSV